MATPKIPSFDYRWVFLPVAVLLLILYGWIDPADSHWFPACPFHQLTSYKCPGCGSQRAIHQLLNGNILSALAYNPLLVISLPYLFFGIMLHRLPPSGRNIWWRQTLYGKWAIRFWIVLIPLYWIGRNILD